MFLLKSEDVCGIWQTEGPHKILIFKKHTHTKNINFILTTVKNSKILQNCALKLVKNKNWMMIFLKNYAKSVIKTFYRDRFKGTPLQRQGAPPYSFKDRVPDCVCVGTQTPPLFLLKRFLDPPPSYITVENRDASGTMLLYVILHPSTWLIPCGLYRERDCPHIVGHNLSLSLTYFINKCHIFTN